MMLMPAREYDTVFSFQHLLVCEDIVLQRFCHLLLHFLRGRTRIDGGNNALADGIVRELILVDVHESEDAESHKARHQQYDYLPVVEAYFLKRSFFLMVPVLYLII